MKLLVIDDDIEIYKLLQKTLNPLISLDYKEALPAVRELDNYDIIVLDMMLEKVNSLEFLKELREQESPLLQKIILLTGAGGVDEEIETHRLGLRDYVKKPFNRKVFSALLDKHLLLLKKSSHPIKYGPFYLEISDHVVLLGDKKEKLDLTNIEYKLLRILIEANGRIVTREKLMEEVWHIDDDTQTRTVDMHVSALRKKLQPHDTHLKTKRGVGYYLDDK